jgi:hypothetical protein
MWCTYCGSDHGTNEPHAYAPAPARLGRPPARLSPKKAARQAKKTKKAKARKEARRPAASYGERDALLRQLGYPSYRYYLDSPLWASIRGRQLRIYPRCHCGRWARQVHHQKYSLANLSGKSSSGLRSVCGGCHLEAEFEDGKKLPLAEATEKFDRVRRNYILSEEHERLKPTLRLLGDMNREFRAIVRGTSALLLT